MHAEMQRRGSELNRQDAKTPGYPDLPGHGGTETGETKELRANARERSFGAMVTSVLALLAPWRPRGSTPRLRASACTPSVEARLDYRPEIDGLRALAILPVVFFHYGIPGFRGGFVGVDVFFVISGYLITSIIQKEIDRGEFSLAQFYARRVRRIFPALFAMLMRSFTVVAFIILFPVDLVRYAQSLFATALFGCQFRILARGGIFRRFRGSETAVCISGPSQSKNSSISLFPALLLALRGVSRKWRATTIVGILCRSHLALAVPGA